MDKIHYRGAKPNSVATTTASIKLTISSKLFALTAAIMDHF